MARKLKLSLSVIWLIQSLNKSLKYFLENINENNSCICCFEEFFNVITKNEEWSTLFINHFPENVLKGFINNVKILLLRGRSLNGQLFRISGVLEVIINESNRSTTKIDFLLWRSTKRCINHALFETNLQLVWDDLLIGSAKKHT